MGFIHTLYYYQVQRSLDDARKEKEKEQEEKRKQSGQPKPARYNMNRGYDHSPASIIEQRKLREENRRKQQSSSSSNVSDVDIEEAFEDAMGG